MVFLIFSATFLALVAANSYAPVAENSYGAAQVPNYGLGNVAYPYYSTENNSYERKKKFYKLKDLNKPAVYDADIKYFKNKGDHYAEISCPKQTTDNQKYTWILADSYDYTSTFYTISNTVGLAGGINIKYVAKFRHGKWVGRDFYNNEKQKFRRVGCIIGNATTIVDVPFVPVSPQ